MKLIYTESAVNDLVRLRAFVAENDPKSAARIAETLLVRMEALAAFPHLGKKVGPMVGQDTIRDMVFGRYVVRYLPRPDLIVVLRIWHQLEAGRQHG